ncbi:MAG: hypothetical protein QF921_13250 [Pseudomonadales bacterium]|jgi:O-antigen/teichoic acid export membrane protein|nr:hypothetical protein [Pseudomonadales bacterium]MDP6470335.1 hypothetical protein [Pseudomonadales bacterium]MDP6827242.1 hypothetical protein [Pseudomonadales bacterium]MDP6972456.1 hypothetical protein [Pseudomonadales bacterium]|tara:strand:+ start:988 stop:1191 length:204 start_codon:yes stop_codon:yes gene_type:complete
MFQLTFWITPSLIVALGCAILYTRAHAKSTLPGGSAFLVLLIIAIPWSLAQAAETILTGVDHKQIAT